jgi:HEAT repeat protein/tRNA A-37 threonylcarbamoyl transferase component Bud32
LERAVKLCSVCHRAYADDDTRCPEHGETLASDPLVGTALGPFAVEAWLAEGGLGIVYRGEHTGIHRPVAIKLLKHAFIADEAARRRFFTEAQAVAKLAHPHLIDIFDLGTAPDGRVYYVMELLQGRTLAERMAQAPLPFATVVPILSDVCEALGVAHAMGLVHRDLKPANLFLVERAGELPFVKVLDFGIAKVLGGDESGPDQLTRTGHLLGTPQYMAPEQIDGGSVDVRADVYALGVILYELATGTLPFAAQTVGGLLKAHLVEAPPRFDAARLAPGVPGALEAVVWKALRKPSAERYDSVRAFADDLGRAARGEPTAAAAWWRQQLADGKLERDRLPATVLAELERGAAPGRRRRGIIAAGAIGIAVVAGGAWLLRAPRPARPASPIHATTQAPKKKSRLPELHSKALGILTTALKDGDPAVRAQAIAALMNGRDARHRTLIEPLVDDADLSVRAAAASALAALGAHASVPALRRVVGTPPRLDLAVAEALLRLGDDGVVEPLRATMMKGDDAARLGAALALADRDPAAHALLARRLTSLPAGDPAGASLRARLARSDATARTQLVADLRAGSPPLQLASATTLMHLGDERGHQRLAELAAAETPLGLVACRALAQLDDQTCYARLVRVVSEDSQPAGERAIAAAGLGASGEKSALERLAPLFDAAEPELRVSAAGAVLAIWGADPHALAAQSTDWATNALGDGLWTVREQAATVLADAEPSAALPLLGRALHDRQPEVRRAAASSLGRARSPEAVALLGTALEDSQGEVRITALRALGKMQQPSARPLLARHLDRANGAERVIAAGQLVKLGDRSHVGELTSALSAADPELRRVAIEESSADPALGRDAAHSALGDHVFGVRLTAALQLAQQGSNEGVAVLQEALRQRGSGVAVQSVNAWMALGHLGVAPAVQLSPEALLDSGSLEVRLAIVSDGARLAPAQAASLLQHALDDRDWRVRLRAVEGIDALGDSSGALRLSLFKRALVDADGGVRAKAGLLYAHAAPRDPDDDVPPPVARDLGVAADLLAVADLAPAVDMAAVDLAAVADLAPRPVVAHPEEAREEGQLAMTSAEIALKSGRYDAAIAALQKAHRLDPRLRIYFSLGEAYRKQGDNESDAKKQRESYARAIAAYAKAPDPRAKSYAAELQERLK